MNQIDMIKLDQRDAEFGACATGPTGNHSAEWFAYQNCAYCGTGEVEGSQYYASSQAQPPEVKPVAWEWRWYDANPNTVTYGQWSEWVRVEPRNLLQTVEDAVNEFRAYIAANGNRYELRALYTAPPAQTPPPRLTEDEIRSVGDSIPPSPKWLDVFSRSLEAAVRKQFGVNDD